jgi:NADH:ubiquinone oxidoreductase subunit 4 (subunit M)
VSRRARLLSLAVVLAAALAPAAAARAAAGGSPRLVLSSTSLTFDASGDSRALTFTNAGDDVLRLGNVRIVVFEQPAAVQFDVDEPGPRELEPGASATVKVRVRAIGGDLPPQVFGALLIPADDPRLPLDVDLRTGKRIARRVTGVALSLGQTHLLTWMIVLPLLGLALLALPPVRRARWAELVALGAAGLPLLLAGAVAARFDPAFAVEDGNRGLQAVAHVVLSRALGVEWFVGVDGVSLLFVVLAPLVGVAAVLASRALEPARRGPTQAGLLAAQAGATCAFVAHDGTLLACGWLVAAVDLVALVGARAPRQAGEEGGRRAPTPFAVAAAASIVLLVLALAALRAHAPATYLHDGTPVSHSLDLMTLAGAGMGARLGAPVLGVPGLAVVGAALFAAFALAMPLVPFHGWAAATFERASPPTALALAGLWSTMGACGLVRFGAGVLPEAARGASTVLFILGALGALHAALLALSARDLARLFAHAGTLQMTFCLLAVASPGPAALAGALATAFARGLAAVLLFSLARALEGPLALASLDGLGARAPGAARGLVFGLAASALTPGLATFVGPVLIALDVAARGGSATAAAVAAFLALAFAAAAHARAGARLFMRGGGPTALRPLDGATLALVVPVGALLLALGLVPAAMLDAVGATVLALAH